jgi:hypothetical protein
MAWFPFVALPVLLLTMLVIVLSAELMGYRASVAVGMTAGAGLAGYIYWLFASRMQRLSRCPSCTATQPIAGPPFPKTACCGACDQPLTVESFDERAAGKVPVANPAHGNATEDQLRAFRAKLVAARRFGLISVVLAGSWFIGAAVALEHSFADQPLAFFGIMGAGAVLLGLLNLRYRLMRCPQCECLVVWRNGVFPWVLPDICANCNKPLLSKDQLRMPSAPADNS